jgi:hypothetical protein
LDPEQKDPGKYLFLGDFFIDLLIGWLVQLFGGENFVSLDSEQKNPR